MLIQALATFGYVIAYVAPAPEAWFLLARIIWGLGSALVFATAYTIAADVSKSGSRGQSMGLIRGGSIFGFPTGLVLGGIVSDVADGVLFALPGDVIAFILATVFSLFAAALAYATVPETHVDGEVNRSIKPGRSTTPSRRSLSAWLTSRSSLPTSARCSRHSCSFWANLRSASSASIHRAVQASSWL